MYVHWLVLMHTGFWWCVACVSVSVDAPSCHGTDGSGFVAFASSRCANAPIPSKCIAYLALRHIPLFWPPFQCFGS